MKVSKHGLYFDVVNRLTELIRGHNVKLFCDNLYSSLSLFSFLKCNYNIRCSGTVRSTRIGLPPAVRNPGKMIRGEFKIFQDTNDESLTACVWQDTRQVRYISTAYSLTIITSALRRVNARYERINQPLVSAAYCPHYQNVDRFDQAKSKYLISRRSYCSWKYLWYFSFQAMIINAYILYKKTHPAIPKMFTQIDFCLQLAKGLIGNFSSQKGKKIIVQPLFLGPDVPCNPQMASHENVRMDNGKVWMCKPHKCFTGSTMRTVYGCKLCGIYVCKDCSVKCHATE